MMVEYRGDWKWQKEFWGLSAWWNWRARDACHACIARHHGDLSILGLPTSIHLHLIDGWMSNKGVQEESLNIMTRWSRDLCYSFPRRTITDILLNIMPPQLNPLTTVIGYSPFQIKWCSMHVVNLGVLHVVNGSAVQLLLEQGRPDLDLHVLIWLSPIYLYKPHLELQTN